MIKKLLGLIMVFHISCSNNKNKVVTFSNEDELNDVSYFYNDTLQQIISGIIIKNNQPKNLNIELIDFDKIQLLNIKVFDSIDDCNNIKAFFDYNNTSLMFINYSKKNTYNRIIDVKKTLPLDKCNVLIMKKKGYVMDPKTYTYRIDDNGRITYPNGHDLIYKNGKLKIEWWDE